MEFIMIKQLNQMKKRCKTRETDFRFYISQTWENVRGVSTYAVIQQWK